MILNSNDIHEVLKLSKGDNVSFIGDGEKTTIVAHDIRDIEFKGQVIKKIYNGGSGKTLIKRDILKLVPKYTGVVISEDTIVAGNRKIKYKINDLVDEPRETLFYLTTIEGKELNHLLSGYYAMNTDMVRPILCGVCINNGEFAACDAFRMAVRKGNFETKEQVVMDLSMVNTLKKIKYTKELDVYYNDDYVKFVFGDLEVIGNRQNGDFIDYNKIIPENYTTSVQIEVKPILDILKDYKKNKFDLVKLDFTDNELLISANNEIASVQDKCCIELKGKALEIAFNINYLIDALSNYEVATLELTSRVNPIIVKADNKLDLILPVSIRS